MTLPGAFVGSSAVRGARHIRRGGGVQRRAGVAPAAYTLPPSEGGRAYGAGTKPYPLRNSDGQLPGSVDEADGPLKSDVDREPLLHVVFFRPQIHWNTGNIGRTCIGIGGARLHLIRPLAFSIDDKHVRRAGLDYWDKVDLQVWDSWEHFERDGPASSAHGAEVFFFTKFGAQSLLETNFPRDSRTKTVLVFGNETKGLTEIEHVLHDRVKVALPMHSKELFRSYNLSTSASIALWEAYRQRLYSSVNAA